MIEMSQRATIEYIPVTFYKSSRVITDMLTLSEYVLRMDSLNVSVRKRSERLSDSLIKL